MHRVSYRQEAGAQVMEGLWFHLIIDGYRHVGDYGNASEYLAHFRNVPWGRS